MFVSGCGQVFVYLFQIFSVDPAAGAAGGLKKGRFPGFACGRIFFGHRFLQHPAKSPVLKAHGGLIPGAPAVEQDYISGQSLQVPLPELPYSSLVPGRGPHGEQDHLLIRKRRTVLPDPGDAGEPPGVDAAAQDDAVSFYDIPAGTAPDILKIPCDAAQLLRRHAGILPGRSVSGAVKYDRFTHPLSSCFLC